MLRIRLQRVGRKHEPAYRVVVTDSRNSTKSGRFLEAVGHYHGKTGVKKLDAERIKHWISKGALPTATIHNMLIAGKVIEGKKIQLVFKRKAAEAPAPAQA